MEAAGRVARRRGPRRGPAQCPHHPRQQPQPRQDPGSHKDPQQRGVLVTHGQRGTAREQGVSGDGVSS